MKIKYTGLTPVNNVFGDWAPGEVKDVPDTADLCPCQGFVAIGTQADTFTRKKVLREDLNDKMERDSKEKIHWRTKK